ncbi:MAG TPA: hypothetical protein VHA14_19515 [Bryobacteraceae bacterium]|nr:hypothetical protein [Bryobacteraceae bacterium]
MNIWKQSEADLPEPLRADEICAMARRRDQEAVWGRWIALFALAGLAAAFLHNAWTLRQTWVRVGQGWMVIVMTVYLWSVIRSRTGRRASDETCARFLLRSFETKRNGYLAARTLVLWIIPGILASWLGGGTKLRAQSMGLDPSSAYYRYLTSIWPMVATCVLLVLVSLAFRSAAKKASAELEDLERRIAA